MKQWCKDIANQTQQEWKYVKIMQKDFTPEKYKSFQDALAMSFSL